MKFFKINLLVLTVFSVLLQAGNKEVDMKPFYAEMAEANKIKKGEEAPKIIVQKKPEKSAAELEVEKKLAKEKLESQKFDSLLRMSQKSIASYDSKLKAFKKLLKEEKDGLETLVFVSPVFLYWKNNGVEKALVNQKSLSDAVIQLRKTASSRKNIESYISYADIAIKSKNVLIKKETVQKISVFVHKMMQSNKNVSSLGTSTQHGVKSSVCVGDKMAQNVIVASANKNYISLKVK